MYFVIGIFNEVDELLDGSIGIDAKRCTQFTAWSFLFLLLRREELKRIPFLSAAYTPQTLSLISHQSSSGFPRQSIDLFWCFLNVNLLGKEEEKERRSKVIQVKST